MRSARSVPAQNYARFARSNNMLNNEKKNYKKDLTKTVATWYNIDSEFFYTVTGKSDWGENWMPYQVIKRGDKYGVMNMDTKEMKGMHESREKAMKQMRLLYMVESGKKPTGKK